MSQIGTLEPNPVVGLRVSPSLEDLSRISERDCAAVIVQRKIPVSVRDWLEGLEPDQLPSARLILQPNAVPDALHHIGDLSGLPEGDNRSWLEADVADLAKRFSQITQATYLRLRMDVIQTNACTRFHIDAVMSRLICTYRGTATQIGTCHGGQDPERLVQVETGAPMILRGTLWPEAPAAGLRHRSPPIAGTGESRLVLVLDPVFDLEDTD